MFWSDCKVGRLGANRLVLDQRHRYRFRAVGTPAFAGEMDGLAPGLGLNFDEVRGDLGHALVDLSEERFIPGESFVSSAHRDIVQRRLSPDKGFICFEMGRRPRQNKSGGPQAVQPEDVFRSANESIAAMARELLTEPAIPFLCECSDKRCFARIWLTIEEYDEARAAPQRYLTISGHEVEGAFVIADDERFALAEKL